MKKSSNKKAKKVTSKKVTRVNKANDKIDMGVTNGDIPSKIFSHIPCTIGYSYIRFEVDGNIRPCCIAKYDIGNLSDGDWRDAWHSGAWMSFRQKLSTIQSEKFHLNDPEWSFCQQCSHVHINLENFAAMSEKKKK